VFIVGYGQPTGLLEVTDWYKAHNG
jgi:hypothetical protein